MLGRIYGITKNDNIPALHPPVRHDRIPEPAAAESQLVHQQVIANQQRVLHGLRGYLERLDDERNDKDRDHHSRQQRLHGAEAICRRLPWHHFRYDRINSVPCLKNGH